MLIHSFEESIHSMNRFLERFGRFLRTKVVQFVLCRLNNLCKTVSNNLSLFLTILNAEKVNVFAIFPNFPDIFSIES